MTCQEVKQTARGTARIGYPILCVVCKYHGFVIIICLAGHYFGCFSIKLRALSCVCNLERCNPLADNHFTPTRLKVLEIVHKLGGGCTAVQIQDDEDMPPVTKQCVWQHLRRLEAYGYLKPRIPHTHRAWALSEKGIELLRGASSKEGQAMKAA